MAWFGGMVPGCEVSEPKKCINKIHNICIIYDSFIHIYVVICYKKIWTRLPVHAIWLEGFGWNRRKPDLFTHMKLEIEADCFTSIKLDRISCYSQKPSLGKHTVYPRSLGPFHVVCYYIYGSRLFGPAVYSKLHSSTK